MVPCQSGCRQNVVSSGRQVKFVVFTQAKNLSNYAVLKARWYLLMRSDGWQRGDFPSGKVRMPTWRGAAYGDCHDATTDRVSQKFGQEPRSAGDDDRNHLRQCRTSEPGLSRADEILRR